MQTGALPGAGCVRPGCRRLRRLGNNAESRLGLRLDGALGQHLHHRTALHLQLNASGHFQRQIALADLADLAQQTARGDHFIALGDGVDHGLVFLLALHLWTNHHKVQHHKHQNQRQHAQQAGLSTRSSGRCGLGKRIGNKHSKSLWNENVAQHSVRRHGRGGRTSGGL